jgi:hypothetical protein
MTMYRISPILAGRPIGPTAPAAACRRRVPDLFNDALRKFLAEVYAGQRD